MCHENILPAAPCWSAVSQLILWWIHQSVTQLWPLYVCCRPYEIFVLDWLMPCPDYQQKCRIPKCHVRSKNSQGCSDRRKLEPFRHAAGTLTLNCDNFANDCQQLPYLQFAKTSHVRQLLYRPDRLCATYAAQQLKFLALYMSKQICLIYIVTFRCTPWTGQWSFSE